MQADEYALFQVKNVYMQIELLLYSYQSTFLLTFATATLQESIAKKLVLIFHSKEGQLQSLSVPVHMVIYVSERTVDQ